MSWLYRRFIGVAGHAASPWMKSRTGLVLEVPSISIYCFTPLPKAKKRCRRRAVWRCEWRLVPVPNGQDQARGKKAEGPEYFRMGEEVAVNQRSHRIVRVG